MEKDFKKRFWVYVIAEYYPSGGVHDVEDTFDSLHEAEKLYDFWIAKSGYEVSIWDMDRKCQLKSNRA